jgi:hypothetical protein
VSLLAGLKKQFKANKLRKAIKGKQPINMSQPAISITLLITTSGETYICTHLADH